MSSAVSRIVERCAAMPLPQAINGVMHELDSSHRSELRKALYDERQAAWKCFLALDPSSVGLFVGAGSGLVPMNIAQQVRVVYVMDPDPARLALLREAQRHRGVPNLHLMIADDTRPLPLSAGMCDFVWVQTGEVGPALLAELHRVLSSHGEIYFPLDAGWPHRWARAPRRPDRVAQAGPFRPIGVRRQLREQGFQTVEWYVPWPTAAHASSIGRQHGWPAVPELNGRTVKTRLLRSLVTSRWYPYLAPEYGVVASKQHRRRSTVEQVVDQLERTVDPQRQETIGPLGIARVVVSRTRILLVELATAQKRNHGYILKLPLALPAQQRLERNYQALETVAAEIADLGVSLPLPVARGALGAHPYYVESRLAGVPGQHSGIDASALLTDAAALLHRLAAATTTWTPMGPELMTERIHRPFHRVRALLRSDYERQQLGELETFVAQTLRGVTLPLVRSHGDFKRSNTMVTPHPQRLTGLFDWDQSQPLDWPLFDLLNFLSSYQTASDELELHDKVARIVSGTMTVQEEAVYQDAVTGFGLSPDVERALRILYWIVQVSKKCQLESVYSSWIETHHDWVERNVRRVLAQVAAVRGLHVS
ncbi:MAG: phosphotransferase [Nitrospirota bacterium]